MWLLNVDTFELKEFMGTKVPPYAILSHTWGSEEISFVEMKKEKYRNIAKQKAGFSKISGCCARAKEDGYAWVWVDSCCIDKRSSAELSEAINSMFGWYQWSCICYVYLSDVPGGTDDLDVVAGSRWFMRGWTLQELLAPWRLLFFAEDWTVLGHIDRTRRNNNEFESFQGLISNITRIPKAYLLGHKRLEQACVSQRMFWASQRDTTRPEDRAYSLMGLFDINIPVLYGEGLKRAFTRLQEEIFRSTPDQSIFAWHDSEFNTCQLLADSPDCFQNSGNVVRLQESSLALEAQRTRSAFWMTNLGLRITLPLRAVIVDHKIRTEVGLHCYVDDEEGSPRQLSLNIIELDRDVGGRIVYMCRRSNTWTFSTGEGDPTSIFIRGINCSFKTMWQHTSVNSSGTFGEVEAASRSLKMIGAAVERSPELLKDDETFAELGVDSLALVDIMVRILHEFGVEICPRDFYDNPTIGEFVAFIVSTCRTAHLARAL